MRWIQRAEAPRRRSLLLWDQCWTLVMHSRQLHAVPGEDRTLIACLHDQAAAGSTLRRPPSYFAWTPSDGSTRFAMSGVRSRVFLPCPPDAYAEPPGWLVWSLRSGRMAARVIYGLVAAVGCFIPTLMGHEWWHKLPARLYLTLVSHQLYVKSSVLNRCGAVPTTLKLLQLTAAASH